MESDLTILIVAVVAAVVLVIVDLLLTIALVAGSALFGWTLRLVRRKGYLSRTHIE